MTTPLFVGLDLGGTEIKVGLCGSTGELVWSDRRPSHAHLGQEAILQALGEAVDGALAEAESGGNRVQAIGLGTPGIVDPDSGVIRFPVANLGGWHGTDIVGFFRDRYQMPAVVENDANAAAWGEFSTGAGKGARILLAVTVGTGIGGGAVIDGEILRGAIGGAMELGHILYEPGGRPCNCGLIGCVEAYAGGWGMAAQWGRQRQLSDPPSVSDLVKSALDGDEEANQVLDEGARVLGAGMMSALHLLNPDVVVIAGGIIDARPRHLELIEDALRSSVLPKASAELRVVQAHHGNRAGLIGAAMCAERASRQEDAG
ncbi:MAG: ROK family protein [Planctomycetota bacterium]|nr:ROK family protein [Planctomycetota bacterium]